MQVFFGWRAAGLLGGKRRAHREKKLPVVHVVAKADNNSPGAMWSRHLLEEKHPDHLPSKAWLKGG